jgi:hypothetical protein
MSVEHGNSPTKLSIGWFMDPACPGTQFQRIGNAAFSLL